METLRPAKPLERDGGKIVERDHRAGETGDRLKATLKFRTNKKTRCQERMVQSYRSIWIDGGKHQSKAFRGQSWTEEN